MATDHQNILGVDPGLACGWALHDGTKVIHSGVWDLKGNRFEGAGMRWLRFRNCLASIGPGGGLARVAYEEVHRHAGTAAAHAYGALIGTLQSWCEDNEIPYSGIPVGHIKKFATGKGNANKDAILKAAQLWWPEANITDHNEADARFIVECAAHDK